MLKKIREIVFFFRSFFWPGLLLNILAYCACRKSILFFAEFFFIICKNKFYFLPQRTGLRKLNRQSTLALISPQENDMRINSKNFNNDSDSNSLKSFDNKNRRKSKASWPLHSRDSPPPFNTAGQKIKKKSRQKKTGEIK